MTKQTNVTQPANTAPQQPADGAATGGWRERLNRAFHPAADNAGYVMNKYFALAASVGIPPVIALADGVPATAALLGTAAIAVAVDAVAVAFTGAAVPLAGVGIAAAAGAAVAGTVGAVDVIAVGAVAAIAVAVGGGVDAIDADAAAQDKARQDGKSDADVQKRAAIGTAVGAFVAACMTAGAIHVYGTNMPERAPADAAPKPTPTASI